MRRIAFETTCIALLMSGIAGAQPSPGLVTLRIASSADEVIASILYARRSGLFQKAGLDVQIERQSSGAAIAAAVTSGTYDLGTSSLVSLFNAHQRGIAFTLVAPGAGYDAKNPYSELLVATDSSIRSGADLNGKIVGVQSLNDLDTVATRAWVDQHGGDSRTIRFIELPMSAKGAALEAHRIDAGIVGQPYLAAALGGGKVRVLGAALSAIAPRFLQSTWFATSEWASKHADVAKKFADVVSRSNAYANGHHAEIAPLLAQFSQMPLAVVAQARGTLGTTLTAADVQPVIDVALKYQMITRPFTAQELINGSVQ